MPCCAVLQVRSICEEMTMDGCERCMPSWQEGKKWADCDLLDTYSYLCYQMPGGCSGGPKGTRLVREGTCWQGFCGGVSWG